MEDTFTAMIALQLRSLGLSVTLRRYDEDAEFDAWDLVVMGPGPGDPGTSPVPGWPVSMPRSIPCSSGSARSSPSA